MIRKFALAFLALLWLSPAWGQSNIIGSGVYGDVKVASGCSQATTFLARTSGLSGTETSAYTTMICGMVTDGVGCSSWSAGGNLDALYIFATNTTTTAALNLCSASFSIVVNGSFTFTADQGWAGAGSGTFLDTQFNPSTAGGSYSLNSESIGVYVRTSRTAGCSCIEMGVSDASNSFTYIEPLNTSNAIEYGSNNSTFPATPNPNGNVQGFFVQSRTTSVLNNVYLDGSLTPLATDVSTPFASLPNATMYIGAINIAGANQSTTDQNAAAYIGAGQSSTNQNKLSNRINAYMTALGANVY